ncbi:hypothetical protein COW46_04865 [Candidatus Gracilibacteria bacterium CG17_big_fil_post_rev_8_21_14_2_50_48_13]|nr:MAG: hypothetical protein COW46_04865 [Candidatus Gracilibacteria bacterium CG17_big_fil_post_rev_8_21_14_2_50_48_13]
MKKILSLALIGATCITGAGVAFAQSSDGAAAGNQIRAERPFGGRAMQKAPFDVNVTKIDQGVVITKTSSDAAVVTKLQENLDKEAGRIGEHADMKDVTVNKEKLDNGIRITLTSTDADTVAKLQNPPKQMERGMGRGHGHPGGKMMDMEGVDISVENVDNGVVVRHTSTDPEKVKALQEMFAKRQANQQAAQ